MGSHTDRRRTSPIPLYYQISTLMAARILTGVTPPGSRLGTEAELAERFEVSRTTIRKALAQLDQRELIDRKRSLGTFVAEEVPSHPPAELHGYLDDLILQSEYAGTVQVTRERVGAPEDVAISLGIAPGTQVVRFERIRATAAGPHAHIVNFVPAMLAEHIDADHLYTTSLLQTLDTLPEARLGGGHQVIWATAADESIATALDIPPGAPVLTVERVVYDTEGVAVELARSRYPGDRHRFLVHLSRTTRSRGPGPLT